eukprot:983706-Amphidinium_carterae.1
MTATTTTTTTPLMTNYIRADIRTIAGTRRSSCPLQMQAQEELAHYGVEQFQSEYAMLDAFLAKASIKPSPDPSTRTQGYHNESCQGYRSLVDLPFPSFLLSQGQHKARRYGAVLLASIVCWNGVLLIVHCVVLKVQEFDPDVIAGHRAYSFDLDLLAARMNYTKVPV